MQINIHNKDLEFIGLLDNDSQHTVNYGDDKWTRTLETGSSVYEFTAFKKDLDYSDEYSNPFNNLKVGNYVSFNYEGEDFLFKIMSTERTGNEVYCYCENLNLELRNEMVGGFDSSDKDRTLEDYIKDMKLIEYTNMSIGINEVNQVRKKLSFTNDETKLARLLSLLSEFGAEHRFYTKLKPNGQIKEFKLDIFTKQDANGNGGYGRMVEDIILRKGYNVKSLKEKEDILEIWNATRPVGKKTITRVTQNKQPVKNEEQVVVKSNMVNANGSLSIENIQTILKLCYEYRLLPSGVISQLYLESFWGNSNVARVDNNWSGMTWTGNPNRPSGVVVSQGSARPSAEGGYYMHFANMSDFFKDYFFLLAKQGIYNVANKNNISDYTRGLFRVGGAQYDYAAAGFDHYNSLMNSIRNGINANNSNVLDEYDEKWKNPTVVQHNQVVEKKGAPNTKRVLQELSSMVGKTLGNGQCYGMVSWYSNKLGGAGLGAGIGGFSGLVGSGIRACDIGTDYNWPAFGWAVDGGSMFGTNLAAGAIINIKANYGAPWYTGYYGHTAVVESVNGNTVTILQQNYAGAQYVTRQKYDKNELIPSLQTIVHPKELASGGRVEGGNVVIQVDGKDEYVNLDLPTDVATTEETVDIYIDGSLKRYWYDKDNNLEFHLVNGALYADQSSQMFPTTFTSYDNEDKWIRRDFEYQVDSEEELIEVALNDLKAHCYPASSYEVEGFFQTNIGNTHIIEDPDFEPMLTLRARVVGQELSFSNPDINKTTLSNYVKLKSKLPNSLEDRFKDLLEQSLPYDLRVTTTNGTSFKNGLGSSKVTVQLLKAGIEKEANFIFKDGDSIVGSGNELTVDATDFDSVLNLTIEAYINNNVVATRSITFTDIADGSDGSDGSDGVGVKSTEVTYTSSTSGTTKPTSGWGTDIPSVPAGSFLWTKTVWTYTDDTSETSYSVSKMGENGEAGKTTYPHWAYADNSTGTVGFSLTDGSNKQYQGYYSDYYQTASTDPTKYTWVDRTANVQVGGRNLYIISKATKGYITVYSEEIHAPTEANEYTSDFIPVSANNKYIFQGWVTVPEGGYPWHRYNYYGADKHKIGNPYYFESNTPLTGKQHYAERVTVPDNENIAYIRISARFYEDGKLKFEQGNVATDYTLAPEDVDEQINSKADEEFTTNQLNALREAESLMKKELEAKAALADVEKWYQNYLDYVSMNDEDKLTSEKELIAIAERLTTVQNDLGATKENWSFLDNYMEVAEEGLILGQKDGSAQVKISNNRISMFSNGSEVMYVTQNMLHIENGVFTKTLQIGNFRFETLDDEEEILVVRYLGGA
ncbi:putative tail fiber protein [Streptococcus phage P738]|nr:putative tail fiber protein [Streptococcus phage P738]